MTFLFPTFLWALGLLGVPVIIHLFNFRKTQKIYFSNTRFIQQVQDATSAKRRLKHLLVLASRILFLFFLVIVFAQPIIPAREQLRSGESILIYLDNSQSMSAPVEGSQRLLDAGITIAKNIAESFPPETRFRLLTNDFAPFSNSLKSRSEVLDLLAQVRLSGVSRTNVEVNSRIARLGNENELFWISDFQESVSVTKPIHDSLRNYHLVPLQSGNKSNVFVDTVFLNNPFTVGGERNTLNVKLFNDGVEARDQLTVRLILDGLQSGSSSLALPANSFGELSFELPGNLKGVHKGSIAFTDVPVTFDNEFYFVLNFSDRISILEIKGTSAGNAISKVYGNGSVFNYTGVNSRNIDYSKIQQSDLVILNELPELDNALTQVILDYLSKGGSILLIPSTEPDITSYKKIVPSLAISKQAAKLAIARPDFKIPFFENIFQEKSAQLEMPEARNCIEWGLDREALLKLRDDKPYLSLFNSQGKIYVLGSPLQESFTTLYNHALFVPVMYRIAAFSKRTQHPLYYLLSQRQLSLQSDSLEVNNLVTFTSGEQEITPAQRVGNHQVVLDYSGMELQQGHYLAKSGNQVISQLAFNQDKQESKLKLLNEKELEKIFGSDSDIYAVNPTTMNAMKDEIHERYQGKPLWKYALLLALLFVLAEVLLLRFWK